MNSKKIKELRRRIKPIQVEWLKTLLPEEQANKVNVDNVEDLLPEQTHHMGAGTLYLSYMTSRWIMKQLKRNPHIKTYEELKELNENI